MHFILKLIGWLYCQIKKEKKAVSKYNCRLQLGTQKTMGRVSLEARKDLSSSSDEKLRAV